MVDLDEFLEDLEPPKAEEPPKPVKRGASKVEEKSLEGGTIENVALKPETVPNERIRLMKVLTITRKPTQRIADFELTNASGQSYEITIDEATARAIASVFDEK